MESNPPSVDYEVYSRPPLWKIFISSEMRSGTLTNERRIAGHAVQSTGLATPWMWEKDAVAGPYSSESVCVEQARSSDGLILIVADVVTNVVRKEYFAARNADLPVFIFLKQGVERDADTKDFISHERSRAVITRNFDNEQQLHNEIVSALSAWAVRAGRERFLAARFRRSSSDSIFQPQHLQGVVAAEPSRQYELILVSLGGEGRPLIPLSNVVSDVQRALSAGHFRTAIDLVLRSTEHLGEIGFADTVLELLASIRKSVPRHVVQSIDEAWLLNTEGLALAELGHRPEAIARFDRMKEIGEEIGDGLITSTALQNLATQLHQSGEHDQARQSYRAAMSTKLAIQDYRGASQVLINAVALAQDRDDLALADELLCEAEKFIESFADPHLLSTFHGNKGNLAVKRGDFSKAESHFKLALKYARRTKDLRMVALGLQNLGATCMDQENPGRALRWYRRALQIAETLGSPPRIAVLHAGLAMALYKSNRYTEAAAHLEKARGFAKSLNDPLGWATSTANLGALMIELRNPARATILLNEALEVFRELADREWQIRTLHNLVTAYAAQDAPQLCADAAEQVLQVLPSDAHTERAEVLRSVGQVHLQTRETLELASDYFQRALIEAKPAATIQSRALDAAQDGAALVGAGAPRLALPFYTQALEDLCTLGDHQNEFRVRNDRAIALTNLGRFDEARRDYQICASLAQALDVQGLKVQVLLNHGEMERRAGRVNEALAKLQQAVAFARKSEDRQAETEALGNLGIALGSADRLDEAEASFRAARRIAQDLRERHSEALATGGLATVAFTRGRFAEATRFYRSAADMEEKSGDKVHLVENLAGLAESAAALGNVEEVMTAGQRLVDAAQQIGAYDLAARALVRVAQRLLDLGMFDEATGAYAAAMVGDIVGSSESPEDSGICLPILAMVDTLTQTAPDLAEGFFDRVVETIGDLQDLDELTLNQLRRIIREYREVRAESTQ